MNNVLFVCGSWDDEGGRESNYCKKLIDEFSYIHPKDCNVDVFNGGSFSELEEIISEENAHNLRDYSVIFWIVNVPNDKPKLLSKVKQLAPHSMLVTSKVNNDRYSNLDLVSRALAAKANLLIEFNHNEKKQIMAQVIDPLGNCFLPHCSDIKELATVLRHRLVYLYRQMRLPSFKVGEERPARWADSGYIDYVKNTGEKLHALVHGANPERFLGNTSFRCTNGFPSFRHVDDVEELIYVSRRNIDKRDIGIKGFVACEPSVGDHNPVEYYGDNKPSVDTPIQTRLYSLYESVHFMVHTHAYVKNAPFTQGAPVPCGSLNEVDKVWEIMPWRSATNFAINLKGHGSIIMVSHWTHFDDFEFVPRPMLEYHDDYLELY